MKRYISERTKSSSSTIHYNNNNKDEEEFYKIKIPTPITHWRTQAKLAIGSPSTSSKSRLLQSGISLGLYRRNSHNILSIPQCQVHHPSINIASSLLAQAAQTVRITPYNEFDGRGLLRYAQFRVETTTGKVSLTLVMNVEKLKECQPQLSRLVKELQRLDGAQAAAAGGDDDVDVVVGDGSVPHTNVDILDSNNNSDSNSHQGKGRIFHSIWVHCNDSEGNAIFARDISKWHPIFGPRYVREPIPGSLPPSSSSSASGTSAGDGSSGDGYLYFAPYVFRQGNMDGFIDIAKEVSEAIPPGSKVCELYAGVGMLGLSALLHHGRREKGGGGGRGLGWLRCSDENPENARCFELAVESMSRQITGRVPRSKFPKDGGRGKRGGGKNTKMQYRGSGSGGGSDLSIKDLMDSVVFESGDSSSLLPFEADPSDKVTYMQANAVSALYRGQALGADVIVVDPPRKGLDEVVLQVLSTKVNPNQLYTESPAMLSHLPRHVVNWTNDARTLIYVSCGFDALARDLDKLLSSNAGWNLVSASGYVLFPGSNHVESVVVLQR